MQLHIFSPLSNIYNIIFYNTLELFWLTLYTYTEKEPLQSVVWFYVCIYIYIYIYMYVNAYTRTEFLPWLLLFAVCLNAHRSHRLGMRTMVITSEWAKHRLGTGSIHCDHAWAAMTVSRATKPASTSFATTQLNIRYKYRYWATPCTGAITGFASWGLASS